MAVLTPTFPAAVDTLTTLGRVSNFATTTVGIGGVNASATTVPITDTSAWPSDGACVIGTEAISYTGKTGASITGCVRGFDGTTAATHAAGDPAYGGAILSAHHEALRDAILALEDVLGANGADLITTLNALYVWRDDYNAKGDLLVATAPGIYTPVGVGANGQVLTADSAETPGVKWATGAGGATELVNTTRAVPTTVGNTIDIGTFQTSLGPHNLRVALTVGDSNFSVAKLYDVATQYDETAGAWRVVRPIADTGPWTTVADYELLLSQSFEVLTLRIRRTLGTGAGVARVRVWEYGTAETFTASSATGTDAAAYTALALPRLTPGPVLATPEVGGFEFDGQSLYFTDDATNGRGMLAPEHFFYMSGDGTDRGTSISDLFGANTGVPYVAAARYLVEARIWYSRTTAGTVIFSLVATTNFVNVDGQLFHTPAAGIAQATSLNTSAFEGTTGTLTAAFPATASQTLNTWQAGRMWWVVETHATTPGNMRIRVTNSAGVFILQRGSYFTVKRLPTSNVGVFVA